MASIHRSISSDSANPPRQPRVSKATARKQNKAKTLSAENLMGAVAHGTQNISKALSAEHLLGAVNHGKHNLTKALSAEHILGAVSHGMGAVSHGVGAVSHGVGAVGSQGLVVIGHGLTTVSHGVGAVGSQGFDVVSHGLSTVSYGVGAVGSQGLDAVSHGLSTVSHGLEEVKHAVGVGKSKGHMAHRRKSELNIFGDGDLISVDFLLESMQAAEKNKAVTKLELEDLVHGDESRDTSIYEGVFSLLKNDSDRPWKYIKIVDDIRVCLDVDGLANLENYTVRRQALWKYIKGVAEGKPVMFQLKIEFMYDTPATTIIDIFRKLLDLNLSSIDFRGELYGVKPPDIGDALAALCQPEDPDDEMQDGVLREMIELTLHFSNSEADSSGGERLGRGSGDIGGCCISSSHRRLVLMGSGGIGGSSSEVERTRVWQKVLRRSIRRLRGRAGYPRQESENSLSADCKSSGIFKSALQHRSALDLPGIRRAFSDGKQLHKSRKKRSKSRLYGQSTNNSWDSEDDFQDKKNADWKSKGSGSQATKDLRAKMKRAASEKPCPTRGQLVRSKSTSSDEKTQRQTSITGSEVDRTNSESSVVKTKKERPDCKVNGTGSGSSAVKTRKERPSYDWIKHEGSKNTCEFRKEKRGHGMDLNREPGVTVAQSA